MRNIIRTTLCAAIAACASAAIAGQTPTTSQPPQTPTTPPAQTSTAGSEKSVVITGCLKEAPPSPGAATTTGAPPPTAGAPPPTAGAPQAANAPSYVLTNATLAPADAAGAAGATGATGTTGTPETATGTSGSSSGSTYRLIANMSALTPHVGKKLALTGVIENQASTSAADPNASGPALRVQSGKILAEKCE